MNRMRFVLAWTLAGAVGVVLLVCTYSRAYPFVPVGESITAGDAERIALRELKALGPSVPDAYVVSAPVTDTLLERRMQLALSTMSLADLRKTGLPDRLGWNVLVYQPDRRREEWTYQALISPSGAVLGLSYRMDLDAKGPTIPQAEGRSRAEVFLRSRRIDPSRFGEPQMRVHTLAARTDLTVRYPQRQTLPGGTTYGIDVDFAGDRLAGYSPWFEDPGSRDVQHELQPLIFAEVAHTVVIYLLAALIAFSFIRRYHEGVIGVGRGLQVFILVFATAILNVFITARPESQGFGFGFATRQQTTWVWVIIVTIFYCLPAALVAFFAWSVGESLLRERWGAKLAAFDALFQRRWDNATVARSALAGPMAGLLGAGLITAVFLPLRHLGVWPVASGENTWASAWPGPEQITGFLGFQLPLYLATLLCLLPLTARKIGRAAAFVATAAMGIVTLPAVVPVLPFVWFLGIAFFFSGLVLLFFRSADLLATLLAGTTFYLVLHAYPLLAASSIELRLHGALALTAVAIPLLLSGRWLTSNRQFTYRYEDVPPHVRRIAERERQRVELETARGIQSSILPELPNQLAGVLLAHAYLPASEVGGDFYDVLALEDGRLAIAVGDVAGHGVSSGLVMSMAKSALAVQVTFNPEVMAVFETLNRTVYQTARRRLLTTLVYALLDPQRKELRFASAGHLYPYRIALDGQVEALESTGYPLGVRSALEIQPKIARLAAGDTLFLFSDGLIEARALDSEDLFGFDRLEQSLARHAHESVGRLRDAVLADIARFTHNAPREDDQTVVVLRLPAVM